MTSAGPGLPAAGSAGASAPESECAACDTETFRAIMSSLPAGVSVITTVDSDSQPRGMTATAVCSVSLQPPMLLVCMDSRSRTLEAIRERGAFAVNVLDARSERIARNFGSSRTADFTGVEWHPSASALGAPVLAGAIAAVAECRVDQILPAGDHHIVLAVVVDGAASDTAALSYARRAYHPIRVEPANEVEKV